MMCSTMYVERGMYSMKKSIRDFFRELLELLFQAAALVIDVLRIYRKAHKGSRRHHEHSFEGSRLQDRAFDGICV